MKISSFFIWIAKLIGILLLSFIVYKIKEAIHDHDFFSSTDKNKQIILEKPIPLPVQTGDKIDVTLLRIFRQADDLCIFYFEIKNISSLDIRTGHFLIKQIGKSGETINLGYIVSDIGPKNSIKERMMYAKDCSKTHYLLIHSFSFFENHLLSEERNDMPIVTKSNISIQLRVQER